MNEPWFAQWLVSARDWWPQCLAVVICIPMAAALVGLFLRLWRMLRAQPGGYAPSALSADEAAPAAWRTLAWVAAAALGARLLLYLWAWCVTCLSAHRWVLPWDNFAQIWVQWDAPHYLKLAEQWYSAPGALGENDHLMLVFFPLFPLLLRGLRYVFGDTLLAAVLLNTACTMGSACLLYRLTARYYGARRARWAVAYLLLNPLSLFLGAPYGEAIFLLLTLAAIDAANRRRYLWAGVWGALSAYTRVLGLVVLGVILLEGAQHWLERRAEGKPRARLAAWVLLCAAVVGLGFAAYLWLNTQVSDSPFTFLEYQSAIWSQRFGNLWNTACTTGEYMLRNYGEESFLGTWAPQAVAMLAVGSLIAVRQRRLPLPWAAYAWAYTYIALTPTWLLSGPRYLMTLAVLPMLQITLTERRWFHAAFLCVQGALLLWYTYLFAVLRCVL